MAVAQPQERIEYIVEGGHKLAGSIPGVSETLCI